MKKQGNLVWGIFLLLGAATVVAAHFDQSVELGVFNIIATVLALAFIVHSVVRLSFASLPFPLAILYAALQRPLYLPHLPIWLLAIAALLATIGLSVMLPKKLRGDWIAFSEDDAAEISRIKNGTNDNMPVVDVKFGEISRYLNSDCLEQVTLDCHFGQMRVYFDGATPAPDGTMVDIECSFGEIELYVPRHWEIIDEIDCATGLAEDNENRAEPAENAPKLTLDGNIRMGELKMMYV